MFTICTHTLSKYTERLKRQPNQRDGRTVSLTMYYIYIYIHIHNNNDNTYYIYIYIYVCIYIYIYISKKGSSVVFSMCGFYCHLSNLRFDTSQSINDCSAALYIYIYIYMYIYIYIFIYIITIMYIYIYIYIYVFGKYASSEIMKRRLLK